MQPYSQTIFFTEPQNLEALYLYEKTLKTFAEKSGSPEVANSLLKIIELMTAHANVFDKCCTANIEWIGKSFMHAVRQFPELSADERSRAIAATFISAFRFLCELEFMLPDDPGVEIREIGKFIDKRLGLFSQSEKQQITYARYKMPVDLIKKMLNTPAAVELRKYSQTIENATKLKADWDTELDERRRHVDAIKAELKNVNATYNFVGLVNGFQHLAATKSTERQVAFWSLITLAVVMVLPPCVQIVYVLSHIDSLEPKKGLLLFTLPAILALELILIYFFRVVLAQFRSVKAQTLQLDLRIALCQFVQSYAEYSMKVKKDDPNVLAKFEAVVFSSLVLESEGIPSTFDGVEQFTNLIKSIRGG